MSLPKSTLILDSSQITSWFDCPQAWDFGSQQNLIQLDGFRPSDAIASGTLGHKLLEIYYTELAISEDPLVAVERAFFFNPDLEDRAEEQFPLSKEVRDKVYQSFKNYLMAYPADRDFKPLCRRLPAISISPQGFLQDSWRLEPLIEKGFSYNLYESSTELYILEGRIDFIGESRDGSQLWMDHKFQLREHQLYEKSIQFRNYSLALGLNLAVVNYIRLHEKPGPKTFVRQPLSFSSYETHCWKDELRDIYRAIAKQRDENSFPQNRLSCAGHFGYKCQFTPLCEEYNLATRASVLKRSFTQKQVWRPW